MEKEAPCDLSTQYVSSETPHGFCLEVGWGAGYIASDRVGADRTWDGGRPRRPCGSEIAGILRLYKGTTDDAPE